MFVSAETPFSIRAPEGRLTVSLQPRSWCLYTPSAGSATHFTSIEAALTALGPYSWARLQKPSGWDAMVDAPWGAVDAGPFGRCYEELYGQPFDRENFHPYVENEILKTQGRNYCGDACFGCSLGGYRIPIKPCAVAYCLAEVKHYPRGRSPLVCDQFACRDLEELVRALGGLEYVPEWWKRNAPRMVGGELDADSRVDTPHATVGITFKPKKRFRVEPKSGAPAMYAVDEEDLQRILAALQDGRI